MKQLRSYFTQTYKDLSIVAVTLGIYFMMMPFDSIPMFGMGSILKILVLLPVGAILFVKLRYTMQINSLSVVFIVYCLTLFFSVLYSIDPEVSFGNFKRVILNMAVVLCTGTMYEYNKTEIEFLKKCLVLGGLGTIALTMVFADYSAEGRLTMSVNGATQDQNYLNGYLFFAFVFFMLLLVKDKKILSLIPVLGIVYFTLLTGSRGALVSLAGMCAVTVFYVLRQSPSLKIRTIVIVIAVVVLLVLLYQPILTLLPESVSQRFSVEYIKEKGNTGRTEIWAYLINRFVHGYATVVIVNEYNHLVAHNLWLDHLIMVGIIGEIVFLAMQFTYIRAAWKSEDPFFLISYIGYLIMMLTLSPLTYKPIWNCMTMIMIMSNYQSRKTAEELETGDIHGL